MSFAIDSGGRESCGTNPGPGRTMSAPRDGPSARRTCGGNAPPPRRGALVHAEPHLQRRGVVAVRGLHVVCGRGDDELHRPQHGEHRRAQREGGEEQRDREVEREELHRESWSSGVALPLRGLGRAGTGTTRGLRRGVIRVADNKGSLLLPCLVINTSCVITTELRQHCYLPYLIPAHHVSH